MRLGKLTIHGITRFKDPLEVDFASYGPGTIGLSGGNGFGKSTVLEASGPGALYRELPRKDASAALGEWLNSQVKAPFLKLTFKAGDDDFEIEHQFAKASAILIRNGVPLVTGKMRSFAAVIEELFGPSEAFYAGPFASQRTDASFGAISVTARKELFRHYLNLGRMQDIHEAASQKAKEHNVFTSDVQRRQKELQALFERLQVIDGDVAQARGRVDVTKEALDTAQDRFDDLNQKSGLIVANEQYQKALKRLVDGKRNLILLGQPPVITQAVVDAAEATWRELVEADSEARRLQGEVDKSQSARKRTHDDLERALLAAERLGKVPCKGEGAYSACELLKGAVEARESIPRLREQAKVCADAFSFAEREMLSLTDSAPNRAAIADAQRALQKARADLTKAQDYLRLEGSLEEARNQAKALRQGLPNPIPALPSSDDVLGARRALDGTRRVHKEAEQILSKLDVEHQHALRRSDDLKRDLAEDARKYRRLAGLDLVAKAFGPHGIQALEIDAAGPTVAALANDLLEAAYGSRFTLEIVTQRNLRSTKGTAEDFSVLVHDRKSGRTGLLHAFSGGEQVILDEALRNAFSLFSADRSPAKYKIETAWRDEQAGTLDKRNKPLYALLLQRMRQIGNLHQVLCITHDAEVADAMDILLRITEDGKIVREH